jgi:hypothetical protein
MNSTIKQSEREEMKNVYRIRKKKKREKIQAVRYERQQVRCESHSCDSFFR